MPGPRVRLLALLALGLAGAAGSRAAADTQQDAVAAEIARWDAFVKSNTATDDLWKDVKRSVEPALGRAQKAQAEGRSLLAMLRLGSVHDNLAAATYLGQRPAEQRQDAAAFEAEWKRMGAELKPYLAPPAAGAFEGVRPELLRAMAQAALPQVRIYYDASLEYGRSTTPDSGLYYLGAAQAARDFGSLARTLSGGPALTLPPLRALGPDLDALEGEMLAAYRPPLSIDKHPEFIGASSALKEARELDAAGLREGALLRYLQSVLRFASLRTATPPPAPALKETLDAMEARLSARGVDHTIGRVFLEAARSDLAEHASDGKAVAAAAVANEVLPRYFAALTPARPPSPRAAARVTLTLVRWPYT
jgi:hypothetical protein